MSIEEKINQLRALSQTEYNIAQYIVLNKQAVAQMSCTQLAQRTFSSAASITRLSKKLKFTGFNELRFALKEELKSTDNCSNQSLDKLHQDITKTIELVKNTNIASVCRIIQTCKRVFIFGSDWGERNACTLFVRNFMCIGMYIIFIPSITELKWVEKTLTQDDCVIIVSFSGEDLEIVPLAKTIQLKTNNLITITPLSQNQLAAVTPHNVYYSYSDLKVITSNNNDDYNMFTTLYIVLDAIFRFYLDNYYHGNNATPPNQ